MGTFNGDSQGFDHLTTSGGRMLVFWWRSSCWTMEHKGYTLWFVNGLFEYDWNIDDLTYPLVVLQFAESQLGLTRIQQTKGYQVAIFIAMWGFNKPKGIDADCWTTAGWVVVTGVCTTWKWLGAEASTMKHEHVDSSNQLFSMGIQWGCNLWSSNVAGWTIPINGGLQLENFPVPRLITGGKPAIWSWMDFHQWRMDLSPTKGCLNMDAMGMRMSRAIVALLSGDEREDVIG